MTSLLQPAELSRYDEQFAAIRQLTNPIAPEDRFRTSIEEVGVGGYIRFEGNTYRVTGMNGYERQGERWPELVLYRLNDGSTQYLEWEKGDEISVFASREKLTLAKVGLRNKEHLWEISEEEKGTVQYGGAPFHYYEDSEVTFYRDNGKEGTDFHQYLFSNESGKVYVAVEEWGDDDEGYEHNVILSASVDPKSIEVLVKAGGGG